MTEELICTQICNDFVVGTLRHQPEAVVVIAEEAQRFVPERTCEWTLAHSGTLYDKWKCSECGYEYVESRTDSGATELVPNYCPDCGAKVIDKVVEQ